MPINFLVTYELRSDCHETILLIGNIDAKLLFADQAYDTNEILSYLNKQNIKLVILPKHNRLYQHDYERKLYYFCHIIENIFLALKRWYAIIIHHVKTLAAFIAFVRRIFILF